MTKNTIIDGIAASEHLDSSGESLSIEGMDISSLGGPDSILNWEHGSKDRPSQVVGKVTFSKKIMKESDAKNKREKHFWNKVKKPFVYIKAELFDGIGHSGSQDVAAMLRYRNKDKGEDSRLVVGFSIEGGKIDKKGMVVTKSIARDVAITVKPCNKVCDAELIEGDVDDDFLYKNQDFDCEIMKKGEFLVKTGTYRDIIIQDIKKSLDSRKDFNEEMDRFKDTKSFKQKEDKVNKINNLAEKTLVQPKDAKAKRSFTEGSASSGKAKNKVAYKDSSVVKKKKSKVMPYTWKSENKMRKAITAGMGGGTPDSKTGGAALGVESIEPTLHKPFKAAGESILKEWEENTPKDAKKKIKKNEKRIKQHHDIVEVHPKKFHSRVNKFRELNDMNRANVHPYSDKDYSQMKTYMTRDGKSGYAIKNGNELVSVHSSERGRGDHLVGHAVKMGAKRLDAYDIGGKLPKLYSKHGFKESTRSKFSPEYADPSNKLLHTNKPDFVEMSIPDKIEQKRDGANKYTQGQKQEAGAKNIGEFDQESINYINERKQQMEKMSQPNMGFKQMGIENKPEMQVKTIDPNKEYTKPDGSTITQQEIEQKKIANKYTQGQKQEAGAKNIGEFDQESINYINERKQQVAAGVDSEETHGVNIYDKEGKVNEAYDYSQSQSKEQMKETKGRGNYPSTKHHEGLHRTFSDLSQRTSEDHSKNLINYMLDNFFDKNTVKGVSDYVSTKYDKDDPHLQEEKLTHILDLITNPEKREDHNEKFVGGKVGDIDYKNLKAGWQKATKFTKKLDRKTLNKINDLYTNKNKNRQVKVEKIPPGGRK